MVVINKILAIIRAKIKKPGSDETLPGFFNIKQLSGLTGLMLFLDEVLDSYITFKRSRTYQIQSRSKRFDIDP